jgi:hypothetical protein
MRVTAQKPRPSAADRKKSFEAPVYDTKTLLWFHLLNGKKPSC